MKPTPPAIAAAVLSAAFWVGGPGCASDPAAAGSPRPADAPDAAAVVANTVAAAQRLITALSTEQQARLRYAFDDEAQRRRWSNLPTGMFARHGVRTGDLTPAQHDAVIQLLAATLSPRGLREVLDTVESDEHLHREAGDTRPRVYGRDEFYVAILGTPSANTPWMWQFGGHHLAINATLAHGRITLAPCYTGGNPVAFDNHGRAVKHLGGDLEAAHRLLQSLDATQRDQAVVNNTRANLQHGPGRPHRHPHDTAHPPQGIAGAALTAPQRRHLLALIEDRVGLLHPAHARPAMREIAGQLNTTRFAWSGPTTPGAAGSYRIHGPTLLLEYSPRVLDHNGHVRHAHAVYRDPTNDYGRAWLTPAP